MTGRADRDRRLRALCRRMLAELDVSFDPNSDSRIRLRDAEESSPKGAIPGWMLGVELILKQLGEVLSNDITKSFFSELKSTIRLVQVRFRKRNISTTGMSEIDVEIGPSDSGRGARRAEPARFVDSSRFDMREVTAALDEMTAAQEDILRHGGKILVFTYDPVRQRLVPQSAAKPVSVEHVETATVGSSDLARDIIEHDHLPVEQKAVHELRRLAFDMDRDVHEIMPLIMRDGVLSGKILQYMNAPIRRRPNEVTNVQQACALLGPHHVTGIAYGLALRPQTAVDSVTFDIDRYWAGCAARAAAAWRIARCVDGLDPQDAYTAGLLCKIGTLAIATVVPDRFDQIRFTVGRGGQVMLVAVEQLVLGANHADISAGIARKWNMPDWFVDVVGSHTEPNSRVLKPGVRQSARIVALADRVAAIFLNEDRERLREDLAMAEKYAEVLGMAPAELAKVFDESITEWQATCGVFDASCREVPSWSELQAAAG